MGAPNDVDGGMYPKLAAYLRRLPDGLASYPECKSKGSLIRTALEGHDIDMFGDGLPDELVRVIRDPPPAGVWTKATYNDALFFTLVDRLYPTSEAMLEWTYNRTIEATKSPLYRALTMLTSPWALLKIGTRAHALFQRGTDMEVEKTDGGVVLRMTHPPFLHAGFNHLSNVAMLRAMLITMGAKNLRVTMTASRPTEAIYRGQWD